MDTLYIILIYLGSSNVGMYYRIFITVIALREESSQTNVILQST